MEEKTKSLGIFSQTSQHVALIPSTEESLERLLKNADSWAYSIPKHQNLSIFLTRTLRNFLENRSHNGGEMFVSVNLNNLYLKVDP